MKSIYMDRFYFCAILALSVAVSSCSLREQEIRRTLEAFSHSVINIPESEMLRIKGRDSIPQFQTLGKYRMVVYTDSTSCSPCALKQFTSWGPILDSLQSCPLLSNILFIFSPSRSKLEEVEYILSNSKFKYPVYLDTCNAFTKSNRDMPTDRIMHTFLIDEDGHVVLVGNPVTSEKMRSLYFNVLQGTMEKEIKEQ